MLSKGQVIERLIVTCTAGHDGTSIPASKANPVAYLTDDFAELGCSLSGCSAPMGAIYRDLHDWRGRRTSREAVTS